MSGETRIPTRLDVVNVVAIQRGSRDPGRYVVMSGDIDSRVSDVRMRPRIPGANDNASGIAGTLEAARVLSRYRSTARRLRRAVGREQDSTAAASWPRTPRPGDGASRPCLNTT